MWKKQRLATDEMSPCVEMQPFHTDQNRHIQDDRIFDHEPETTALSLALAETVDDDKLCVRMERSNRQADRVLKRLGVESTT